MTWVCTLDSAASTPGWVARGSISDEALILRGTVTDGDTVRPVSWKSLDRVHWTRLAPGLDLPDVTGTLPSDPVSLGGRSVSIATLLENGSPTRAVVLVREAVAP